MGWERHPPQGRGQPSSSGQAETQQEQEAQWAKWRGRFTQQEQEQPAEEEPPAYIETPGARA